MYKKRIPSVLGFLSEKIVFNVRLADSHMLTEFAAGDLHLMLLVTPTDVPYLKVQWWF
jgi:hypothetical protein